jgi:hypothetical protein
MVILCDFPFRYVNQWIGLRENLQETMVFTIKYGCFPVNCPLNQFVMSRFTSQLNHLDVAVKPPRGKLWGHRLHRQDNTGDVFLYQGLELLGVAIVVFQALDTLETSGNV